jgi:hypothetical protein
MAASIGADCKPSGLINMARELAFRTDFWRRALKDIDDEVAGAQQALQISVMERQKDKMHDAQIDREMRSAGITPEKNAELDRVLADADKSDAEFYRTFLQDTQRWATKCRIYAGRKLAGN